MDQPKLPNLRRAVKIGLIIGLLMILGTGLAIFREFHKADAAAAQVAQMELTLQQHKAQHPAGAHSAPHPAPAPGHATPPTPSPAKPSAPR